jgi:hypothetical protein
MKKRGFCDRRSTNQMQTTSNRMAQLIKKVISGVTGFSGNSMGSAFAETTERKSGASNQNGRV